MISRNGPCPCGSGKQYKRCCGNNEGKNGKGNNNFFARYNSIDLLQTIAAITLLAENHGKNLRLETMANDILKLLNNKKERAPVNELRKYTDKHYCSEPMEDPSTNLFTEVIIFSGGDHIVLPGITQSPAFILNHLLPAIYNWPANKLPVEFKSNCSHITNLVLKIADHIARKAGLTRYMRGDFKNERIHVPPAEQLQKLKQAVFISTEEMNALLSSNSIATDALELITLHLPVEDIDAYNDFESPLHHKPVIKTVNGYLIASPANLSLALIQLIKNTAENFSCTNELHDAYHAFIWNETGLNLQRLGFAQMDIPELPVSTLGNMRSVYARFDTDKIALIQYLPVSQAKSGSDLKKLREEREALFQSISALEQYKDFQFLDVTIISAMGNEVMAPLLGTSLSESVLISTYEFDIFARFKKSSAIDLWKYSRARKTQVPEPFMFSALSFLDEYSIYKDHEDSFYLSDEGFDLSKWRYGASKALNENVKLRDDEHSVFIREQGRLGTTQVVRMDRYTPIYTSLMDLAAGELRFAVEGFDTTIWVKPEYPASVNYFIKDIQWQFTETISYWLWQIQCEIKDYICQIDTKCLKFSFILKDESLFENLDDSFKRDTSVRNKFELSFEEDTFYITIPVELMSYFYGPDNEGDRILVGQLLEAVNLGLEAKGVAPMNSDVINDIIERHAPLGMKKKLILHHSRSNLFLDRSNLKKVRYIQEFDVSTVANSLAGLLGKNLPPVGEITDPKQKRELVKNIVLNALLPHLKMVIDQYDNDRLIEWLIGLNESLIHDREDFGLKTPTRIACFVTVDEHTKDLVERFSDISRTSIAVRCLLEHLAAEPSSGNKMVSKTAVDQLIAIMDAIISWGTLGDQLTFKLFDIRMGVLPSGRIGTQKTVSREIFDPYYKLKAKENVIDAVNSFNDEFPTEDKPDVDDIPGFLNKAFISDFRISLSRICEFIDLLAGLGFKQSTPFAAMDRNTLLENARKHKQFGEEEFDHALNFLSLKYRGTVEKGTKDEEFEPYDISPWRFNRRLSLLRRPLIICNKENSASPLIYWGPRQVLLSRITIAEQLFTGRFKVNDKGEVKKAMSKLTFERGAGLVKRILSNLQLPNVIIDSEVFISPKGKLKNEDDDLGDVDVLLIDLDGKVIYSLECKNFAASRNIKEIIEEIEKLLGSDTDRGLIEKHKRRHEWLSGNLDKLGRGYNYDLTGFTVKSAFVTREGMLFPFLKNLGITMPFLSLYDLEAEGFDVLKSIS